MLLEIGMLKFCDPEGHEPTDELLVNLRKS